MKSDYAYNLLYNIMQQDDFPNIFYDESSVSDIRGVVTAKADGYPAFAYFVKEVAARGWNPIVKNDPKNLKVCVHFDCSGDDFSGLQVSIGLKDIYDYCKRRRPDEKTPSPIPELTGVMNCLVKEGSLDILNDIAMLEKACNEWTNKEWGEDDL